MQVAWTITSLVVLSACAEPSARVPLREAGLSPSVDASTEPLAPVDAATPEAAHEADIREASAEAASPWEAGRAPGDASVDAQTRDAASTALEAEDGGSNRDATRAVDATPALDASPMLPADLADFRDRVHQASLRAQANSPLLTCSVAIPAVRVASAAEVTSALRAYASRATGVVATDILEMAQPCNRGDTATCANIFQNDLAHLGGSVAVELYPLAQQIDAAAGPVQVMTMSPVRGGVTQHVVVLMAGINNGWLMGIATFDGQSNCD